MSSTGIRKRRTTDDRTDDTLKQVEDGYIRKAKRFTDQGRQETGNAGPGAIGGASIPGASYLPLSGKYGMIGSLAFNPTLVAIDDGRINITPNQSGASKDSSYILVTGQGSPDDLRFIDGAGKNGQIFWLQGTLTQIINLKAATISGIDSISGLLTVTVVTTSNHNLTTNDKINILATTNFNVNDVEVTVIDGTTFTYSAVGNITSESAGFVQNGNFVTDTGDDIVLDGTKSLNGVPMIPIIFDPTVAGNGAWRPAQLVSVSGGGDVTFPIDFPEEQREIVGSSTEIIDFTQSNRHAVIMELDGDIILSLINTTTNKLQISSIKLKQDGTGGHAFIGFSQTVGNEQVIIDAVNNNNGPNDFTEFVVEFTDGLFTAYLKTGNIVSGGGGTNDLSDLVINIASKDWLAQGISNFGSLTGVTAVQYVDTGSVVRGSMSGDAGAAALRLSLAASGKFIISDVITDIVSFDDTIGITIEGFHVINMGNNIINSISELQLLSFNAHTPSNELSIAFDTIDDELKYSVALTTDAHSWYADTDRLASIVRTGTDQGQLNIHDVISDILQANTQLILANSSLDPGFDGEFRTNGIDVKVFSGGAVRNLSNVGASPSSIIDGNSSATILDAAPSFVVVLDGVQKYSISNTRVDYADLDLFGINQINMTDPSSNDISSLTASSSGLLLNILSTSNVYDIKFNSADAFHVDDIRTRILSTTPNTTPATLSMFRDDSSPTIGDELGIIKFEGNNSASAFTTYGEISTTIENLTAGAEYANFFVNLKQNGFDVDMFRLVNGIMILRTFNSVSNEGAIFNLLKEDATPSADDLIAKVNFSILDSPTETIYLQIEGLVGDATDFGILKFNVRADNNNSLITGLELSGDDNEARSYLTVNSRINSDLAFGFDGAGSLVAKISPVSASTKLAIVVQDNVSFTEGTGGMLAVPALSVFGADSKAQLDVAYGTHKGAIGLGDETAPGTMYMRHSNGNWSKFIADSIIV